MRDAIVSKEGQEPTDRSSELPEASAKAPTTARAALSHVVGIGASAGGLEALERLFAAMPRTTGMAFVVVQHLSPDFKSLMNELLARRTDIPIQHVEDGIEVKPDNIYLIPPKKSMIMSGGRLLLSDKDSSQELSLPIDVFFRSLAQDFGSRAVGVILSGSGSDGSRGIREIREAGGLVVCQDDESAKFDGMPKSARDTGVVDFVVTPEAIPQLLIEHADHPFGRKLAESLTLSLSPPRGMGAIYRLLQSVFGLDFSHYKPNTITRRIERRLQLNRGVDLDDYARYVEDNRAELDALYRDLLIGVTRFFRDEAAFQKLEDTIVPELFERAAGEDELRIWIAGCATGEEAYSIAILLQEHAERIKARQRLRIFATDVHRGSLEVAARAVYDGAALEGMSPERLDRHFVREGSAFRVAPELRQLIVFAPHNVVKDAPFTKLDLISCRNLLIYLETLAQKKVLSMFHFALKRGGVLFLGPSESTGPLSEDFDAFDAHWRIYKKQRDLRIAVDLRRAEPTLLRGTRPVAAQTSAGKYSLAQVMATYDSLLDEFMPPSLLINERREVVHAFGGAGKYLKLRDGRPSLDVLEMVEPELKMALSGALQRALKDSQSVIYDGLRLGPAGSETSLRLSVRPVRTKGTVGQALISLAPTTKERVTPPPETHFDLEQVSREQLGALEAELRYTKENLQATIEELETSNEELQAANEELVASNEELQSTNEELQSVNEELYTVNAEYQKKIAELTELTKDMDNLLASTDVGTIFLDRELCIRRFTPKLSETFRLVPHDIGRPIDGFTSNIEHPGLMDDLRSVLATGRPIERELRGAQGNWFFVRILPYRGTAAVEGIVITLIDTSSVKAAEDALFHERYLLDSLLESVPDAIYFKDANGLYVRINHAMAERLGIFDPRLAVGKKAQDFLGTEPVRASEVSDADVLGSGQAQGYTEEHFEDARGRHAWCLTTRQPLADPSGRIVGIFGVSRDITDHKRAEDKIKEEVRRRDQFLAMLSHELRNPLGAMTNAAALLERSAGQDAAHAKALDVINRQAHHMARLLDDLLEVSRIKENKIELRRTPVDLREIVDDAVKAAAPEIERRGLMLELELHPSPISVDADAARLQQVVSNLLSNAIKYTPRGGHISVAASREGNKACIHVCDDGVGIPEGMMESVFELFVQSETTLDRAEGGMGVGLTLVRSLVEMHGGAVHAKSAGPGKGSEFVAELPISAPSGNRATSGRRQMAWPRGGQAVLVEDSRDSREMLEQILEIGGYRVLSADNGHDGLALIESERPALAIIDIGLPGMNGYEVARRVRSEGATSTYLVALTGYGQPIDRLAALAAGFDEHLVKPLHPDELARITGWKRPAEEPVAEAGGAPVSAGLTR